MTQLAQYGPGTAWVFTGTRKVERAVGGAGAVEALLLERIAALGPRLTGRASFITGAQYGVDYMAARLCMALYPSAHHSLWLPAKRHADVGALASQYWPAIRAAGGSYQLHRCVPGTDYRYRNLCMLQEAYDTQQLGGHAEVLAFPLLPEDAPGSKYSGTWLCKRQAGTAMPVRVNPLWQ